MASSYPSEVLTVIQTIVSIELGDHVLLIEENVLDETRAPESYQFLYDGNIYLIPEG